MGLCCFATAAAVLLWLAVVSPATCRAEMGMQGLRVHNLPNQGCTSMHWLMLPASRESSEVPAMWLSSAPRSHCQPSLRCCSQGPLSYRLLMTWSKHD